MLGGRGLHHVVEKNSIGLFFEVLVAYFCLEF